MSQFLFLFLNMQGADDSYAADRIYPSGALQHDAPLRPLILLREHQWLLLDVWFCLLYYSILSS
jgi:hypothetical protein